MTVTSLEVSASRRGPSRTECCSILFSIHSPLIYRPCHHLISHVSHCGHLYRPPQFRVLATMLSAIARSLAPLPTTWFPRSLSQDHTPASGDDYDLMHRQAKAKLKLLSPRRCR